MKKNLISRIIIRLKGLVVEAEMYKSDIVRTFYWHVLRRKTYYQNNFDDIAGRHKWIFIIGCNNSGTSIVQRIMSQTGSVSTMKLEGQRYTRVFTRAMRSGKERVWMEYENDLLADFSSIKKQAPRLLYDWLSHTPEPRHDYILEKTPANLLRMEWLDKALPECYFIGLVRDGYAVSEGVRRKSHKSIERASVQWSAANKALQENRHKVKNYLQLRYEDIVDNPEDTFVKISEFIGTGHLKIDDAMKIDYGLKTVGSEKVKGLKNFNQNSIDRLSAEDLEVINQCAGNMLKHYGYFRDNIERTD